MYQQLVIEVSANETDVGMKQISREDMRYFIALRLCSLVWKVMAEITVVWFIMKEKHC